MQLLLFAFQSQRAKVTRSPDTQGEMVRRERGQKADTRLIVATAAIPLYRSFAKVRQFAFSSRMRQRRGRRTPPPDNISTLATPLFQPSAPSTIFSSHSCHSPPLLHAFSLIRPLLFDADEDRGSFYANPSSRKGS